MTSGCAELDEFFDGELAPDQADEFRSHLVDCERCQHVLLGRMQEDLAAHVDVSRADRARRVTKGETKNTIADVPALVIEPPRVPPPAPMPALPRQGGLRRVALYLGPVLAAAAATVVLCIPPTREPGFVASIDIDRAPVTHTTRSESPQRGLTAHVRDVVRAKVVGERHQAIWVYLDERKLVFACPNDDPRCTTASGELALRLPLNPRGQYAIVSLGSSEPIPAPPATLDKALAMAIARGLHKKVDRVSVE